MKNGIFKQGAGNPEFFFWHFSKSVIYYTFYGKPAGKLSLDRRRPSRGRRGGKALLRHARRGVSSAAFDGDRLSGRYFRAVDRAETV